MTRSRLPRVFGAIGILVGCAFMVAYLYTLHYNPFHFPTWEQAQHLPDYSPPPLYHFLFERLMFVLVPGLLLQFFSIGVDGWFATVMWIGAVLLNGPIYFAVGFLLQALVRRIGPGRT